MKRPSLSALSASRLYPLETGPGGDHRHDEDDHQDDCDDGKHANLYFEDIDKRSGDVDANKDTYFTPINKDGVGRQCDPNKSVEGNCEGVDTLDLHQEVHPRRNCIKGHQPL